MKETLARARIEQIATKIRKGFRFELSITRRITHALNTKHVLALREVRARYKTYLASLSTMNQNQTVQVNIVAVEQSVQNAVARDLLLAVQSQELVSEATQIISTELTDYVDDALNSSQSMRSSVQCGSSSPIHIASPRFSNSQLLSHSNQSIYTTDPMPKTIADADKYVLEDRVVERRSMFEDSASGSDQDSSIENISAFLREDLDPLSLLRQ